MKVKNSFYFLLIFSMAVLLLNGCASETPPVDQNPPPPQTEEQKPDNTPPPVSPPSNSSETQSVSEEMTPQTIQTADGKQIVVSRPAYESCTWEEFDASEIGLKFPMQKCTAAGYLPFTFKVEDNALVQYINGKKDYKVIEVFHKKPTQTPEDAIKEQFIKKLNAKEQQRCIVRKDQDMAAQKAYPENKLYMIEPNDQYFAELRKAHDGPFDACGDYGLTDGIQYFLFKDDHPDMFAFVRVGEDLPLFDEQNITFLGK